MASDIKNKLAYLKYRNETKLSKDTMSYVEWTRAGSDERGMARSGVSREKRAKLFPKNK